MRTAFNASRDLYRYAQALAPAVHAGDADATWLMARVVDTCAVYATDPAAYARDSRLLQDMGLDAGAALRAARDHVASRCGRFVAGDDFSLARTTQLRRDAAQAGSLAAEAELLAAGQPLEAGEDYAQELLERVHASFDGEAYSAIAPAVGGLSTASLFGQRDVAPQYRELVWHLAACRLGMDCGPDSPLMTSYCVNGGICSRDRAQGFEEFAYDAAVPRQSADVVRRAVDALVGRRGE
ncbi:hypothetical protein E2F46_13170 [Luteimonas aestuarii]|uniref:Uncharacterized protein n=1 Tax=Luteimonas aestuarii TaxID=453837 RepID=A0A4R5TK68_9GAMM|nr:hypothetical protein E2F46_13170 [Luteimonas aestuarii]